MLPPRSWITSNAWWLGLPATAVVAVALRAPLVNFTQETPAADSPVRRIAYVHPQSLVHAEPRPLTPLAGAKSLPLSPVAVPTAAADARAAGEPSLDPAAHSAAGHTRHVAGRAVIGTPESGPPAPVPGGAQWVAERPKPEQVYVDSGPAQQVLEPRMAVPPAAEPAEYAANHHNNQQDGAGELGTGAGVEEPDGTSGFADESQLLTGSSHRFAPPYSINTATDVPPPQDWSATLPSVLAAPQATSSGEIASAVPAEPLTGAAPVDAQAATTHQHAYQQAADGEVAPPESPVPLPLEATERRSAAPHWPEAPLIGGMARRFAAPSPDCVAVMAGVSDASLREQVQQHLASGYRLAQRGALYSARSEFETALRVIAHSHDVAEGATRRTQRLAEALTALEEADDLLTRDPRGEVAMNLHHIVAAHRTPVLREQSAGRCTPLEAMQAYYAYAQHALSDAVGQQPIAGETLYGLGKLYSALAKQPHNNNGQLLGAKAMLMYQAALTANPQHHLAANELGVMLARYGQFEEAKRALLRSVALRGMPENWHNLAVVHRQLGEHQLAELATIEQQVSAELLARTPRPLVGHVANEGGLEWIDVDEAVRQAARSAGGSRTAAQPGPTPPARSANQSSSIWNWLPWNTMQR